MGKLSVVRSEDNHLSSLSFSLPCLRNLYSPSSNVVAGLTISNMIMALQKFGHLLVDCRMFPVVFET